MEQRAFDHVLIIMFENQYRGYVMENEYMRRLAEQGINMTNYFGVMHPSQTNYIASIAGELCNVTDDDQPSPLPQKTIVDLIEASPQNLDWRAYMDSYIADATPWKASDFSPQDHYPYVIKHNPFSSFKNILESEQRWKKIDNEAGLYRDLLNNQLPAYAWFTPDMWHDGHYLAGYDNNDALNGERAPALVDQQAQWLESFFKGLKFPGPDSLLPENTLVVVTYDEADFEALWDKGKKYTYDGPNQIYTVLLGSDILPGEQAEGYNHYSLLKTIEKNFNLGSLEKNDQHANWFQFLWGRELQWWSESALVQEWQDAPVALASASFGDQLFLFSQKNSGQVDYRTLDRFGEYSESQPLVEDAGGLLAAAANKDGLLLCWRDTQQQLQCWCYSLTQGWHAIPAPVAAVKQISLQTLPVTGAIMLVVEESNGQVSSHQYLNSEWGQAQNIELDAPLMQLQLAVLGAGVFLVGQQNNALLALTYNTASYNQTQIQVEQYAGPYDNATVGQWSPCSFPVLHFSDAANALTPGEAEPTSKAYRADGQMAMATLDGVLHCLHNVPNNRQLMSASFSICGVLTPKEPVSYDPAKQTTTNNGYGTLFEAGWSEQQAVNGAFRCGDAPITLASFQDHLWLFYWDGGLKVHRAGYVAAEDCM